MSSAQTSIGGSYVLTRLDLYDWGAFGGRHSAPIDLAGTAIIGPTGSGKTTLVDALMTLLVASPRYNLASTGGHDSDRDLVSYVRGVSGAGKDDGSNEHIARPGQVVTGIAARFSDGQSVVQIGGLFWFDGTSSAWADLKRRWFFCQADGPDLDAWLEAQREGGARALKDLERVHPGLKVYDTKQSFLARLRTQFEVGENAFALLNRAAGLKQLDSIDRVFRELVLDDRAAFDAARAVADEFDTLAGIRQELETARKQRDSLGPVARSWREHQQANDELEQQRQVQALLPIWFAIHGLILEQTDVAANDESLAASIREQTSLERDIKGAEQRAGDLQAIYLQAGGRELDLLRERIAAQGQLLVRRDQSSREYAALAGALGLDPSPSPDTFQANRVEARRLREQASELLMSEQQAAYELGARKQAIDEAYSRCAKEMEEVKRRPGSNIPVPQQQFRSQLAEHLEVSEADLPFVAELVEVKVEEREWRGAIERAIGGERLRILVDSQHAKNAVAWVDSRDNRLDVRIHEAAETGAAARFFDDGYTRKLNFKPHAHREALKRLLADIDRHCVGDTETLRRTPYSMTTQGTMAGRQGYFDKQDSRPLAANWMTGFDNRDQLAGLARSLSELVGQGKQADEAFRAAQQRAESTRRTISLLERIEVTDFESIDTFGARRDLDGLQQRLADLMAPESDLDQAKKRWETAQGEVAAFREQEKELGATIKVLQRDVKDGKVRVDRLRARIGSGLNSSQQELAERILGIPRADRRNEIDRIEREQIEATHKVLELLTKRCSSIAQQLVREMGRAKVADTGSLSEVGTDLQDVPAYLERLRILDEEALPDKLGRFLKYLNQSSDQGVTQLLSEIDSEVTAIEERISDLNSTLQRVDFQPNRYLRLEPQRVEHESLRTLRQARAHLRSAQLKDDQGESHYEALAELVRLLRDAVDRRKTLASLALLDPRYRLQFAVLVIDRDGGKLVEKRTSSQGGSGGEKEIIASYVLTASLSYALCPAGSERPLFGTIVLDEAFSKSSQAVAGRIIRALSEFGLHPLFVTPNKELRLLREHTRSAIVVHRRGFQATLTSLSWEELEAHAVARLQRQERDLEVAK